MNIAEENILHTNGMLSSTNSSDAPGNRLSGSTGTFDGFEKSFSRVSRLRDMFQTGIIRPIEEIDTDPPFQEPPVVNWSGDHARFLRSFPGSPPLSALRAHRNTSATHGQSTAFKR
ncbi:hypothetical protein P879_10269, partial [Paragonimus westermani]